MLACVDVDYRADGAVAACALFGSWPDGLVQENRVRRLMDVAPYQPGRFYKRELPCLLAVLADVAGPLETILVDGYVWTGAVGQMGLGAHLWEALGRSVPIVGVAKTLFRSATAALPVVRGDSQRPLWVTAAGLDVAVAAENVRRMHGPHRLPTLLKHVDHLCRSA
jgi:deoxyribonuclease V